MRNSNSSPALEPVVVEVPFKGDRNYIRGTDLYTKAIELIRGQLGHGEIRDIDLVVYEPIETHVLCQFSTGESRSRSTGLAARVNFQFERKPWHLDFRPDEKKVTTRLPLDEKPLEAGCRFAGERGLYFRQNAIIYSDVEIAVGTAKVLHNHCWGESKFRWLLVRLFTALPLGRSSLEEYETSIQTTLGGHATRTELSKNGTPCADVYFYRQERIS
jgi:hypothetical protein